MLAQDDSTTEWPAPLDGAGLPNLAPFNEVQYASSVEARSVFFVLNFSAFSIPLSTFPPEVFRPNR